MKRNFRIISILLVLILALTGCQCEHEWKDATCDTPKTCSLCDSTEGAPLSHTWSDATCSVPKNCTLCGITEGDPIAHTWRQATCTAPKTCETCQITDGNANGHNWQEVSCVSPEICLTCELVEGDPAGHQWADATCDTPKNCTVCHNTEGQALGHQWQGKETKTCAACGKAKGPNATPSFSEEQARLVFGSWKKEKIVTAEDLGLSDQTGSFREITVCTFRDDGTLDVTMEIDNPAVCRRLMKAAIIAGLCKEYGSIEAADKAVQDKFDKSLETYATQYANVYLEALLVTPERYKYFVWSEDMFVIDSNGKMSHSIEIFLYDNTLKLLDDYDTAHIFTRA